jgi:hypothetical protein
MKKWLEMQFIVTATLAVYASVVCVGGDVCVWVLEEERQWDIYYTVNQYVLSFFRLSNFERDRKQLAAS